MSKYPETSTKARFLVPIAQECGATVGCDAVFIGLKTSVFAAKNRINQYDRVLRATQRVPPGKILPLRIKHRSLATAELPLYSLSWTAETVAEGLRWSGQITESLLNRQLSRAAN